MNLYFYPDSNSYVVGSSKKGYHVIDNHSSAFSHCEFLRHNYPAFNERDFDGDFSLSIKVSSDICKLLFRFIDSENRLLHEINAGHLFFLMESEGGL